MDLRATVSPLVSNSLDRATVAFINDRANHALESQLPSILRAEDVSNSISMQLGDLLGKNRPAASAVDAHVSAALLTQTIDEVLEKFHVTALVG